MPAAIADRILTHRERGFTEFVLFCADRAARPTLELLAEGVLPRLR